MSRRVLCQKIGGVLNPPNTFIGGVSSVITNETQLATYLSITDANISNFVITGDDISCYINADYSINANAFDNGGGGTDWGNGALVTYFYDGEDRCTTINTSVFIVQSNFRFIKANGATLIGAACFNATRLKLARLNSCATIVGINSFRSLNTSCYVYIPVCTALGTDVGNNNVFLSNPANTKVVTNNFLSTVNTGSPDGDLVYVTGTIGGTVTYRANTTVPSSIVDLVVVGTVYATAINIEWTAPVSTNTIDHYEIWIDDMFFVDFTTALSYTILNLEPNIQYSIKVLTVDIYGNLSESNTVVQTTNATYIIPTANIISYWNFDANSNDQVGTNNGTDTSISYVPSTIVDNCASFNGTTSNIDIPDSASLSFASVPFSICFWVKFDSLGNMIIMNKMGASTNREYLVQYVNTLLRFRLFSGGGTTVYKNIDYTISPITGAWYHVAVTDDGSNIASGANMYINRVSVGAKSLTGSYTGMLAGNNYLMIGQYSGGSSILFFAGDMDETAIFDKELTAGEISDIYAKNQAGLYLTE